VCHLVSQLTVSADRDGADLGTPSEMSTIPRRQDPGDDASPVAARAMAVRVATIASTRGVFDVATEPSGRLIKRPEGHVDRARKEGVYAVERPGHLLA
jgi:hypothetical protein